MHREHLISCSGVKLFLLKDVTITTTNYMHERSYPFQTKKYQLIWFFCPVSFQAQEVILIPPEIYFHISEYQEIISRCLQKIGYHHISTNLRQSTNKCLMPDYRFVIKIEK